MRVMLLTATLLAMPIAGSAQSLLDCEILGSAAHPRDLHAGSTFAVQITNGRVVLVLRRKPGEYSEVIDLLPNPNRPGNSVAMALAGGLQAEAAFQMAEVRSDGTVQYEEWNTVLSGSSRTRTSFAATLRCGPAPRR